MNLMLAMKSALLFFALSTGCWATLVHAGTFSLEIVEPANGVGEVGILRIIYDGDYTFENGGLDLKLSNDTPGVIKFLDASIINNDDRWVVASTSGLSDDSINHFNAASLLTTGLAGNGSRIFAEVTYSLLGNGSTNLLLDIGGQDPVVHGPLGDVSADVYSRSLCLGDCLPNAEARVINLGDSWAALQESLNPPPVVVPQNPVVNIPPVVEPPVLAEPTPQEPIWEEPPLKTPPSDNSNPRGPDGDVFIYIPPTVELPHVDLPPLEIVFGSLPSFWQRHFTDISDFVLGTPVFGGGLVAWEESLVPRINLSNNGSLRNLIIDSAGGLVLQTYDSNSLSASDFMAFTSAQGNLRINLTVPEPSGLVLAASVLVGISLSRRSIR